MLEFLVELLFEEWNKSICWSDWFLNYDWRYFCYL